MTYVRDPDWDKTTEELEREADEWRAQATPEQLAHARARMERMARLSAECRAAGEARSAMEEADTAAVMVSGCWHDGDHVALHEEAARWAKDWATRISADAPPHGNKVFSERFLFIDIAGMRQREAIWASVPARLRGCLAATPHAVMQFAYAAAATPPATAG